MADLSKVRVQVLDPETGRVIENVDVKTSDGAVYLPDGTTLRNWINNSESVSALIQQTLAAHTNMKHVDAEKVDGVVTSFTYDSDARKITAVSHKGETVEVSLAEQLTGDDAGNVKVSVADGKISASIAESGVDTAELKDSAVATAKIANNAVTEDKLSTELATKINTSATAVENLSTTIAGKINELDATVEQTASDTNPLALKVIQTDGKVESIEGSIAAETFDEYGAAKAVQGETTETVASVDEKVTTLTTNSAVTVEKLSTPTEGYLSSYVVKQGGTQVGATIDIPKDYLVKKSNVVTFTNDADNVGKYLKNIVGEAPTSIDALPSGVVVNKEYVEFVVNTIDDDGNESTMYLDVSKLVDVYTGSVGTEVTVTVENNTVAASLVDGGISTAKIADGAVTNDKIADATIARAKIDAAFEQDIADIEDSITTLGDDIDAKISLDDTPADLKLTTSTSTNFISLSGFNTPYETALITSINKDETVDGISVTPTVFNSTGTDVTSEYTLGYQWYKKVVGTDSAFVAITGATSATLPASELNTTTVATTSYHVVVTATHSTDTSIEVDPVVSRDVTIVVLAD